MILGRTDNGEFFLHDILREVFYSLLAYPEEMHTHAAQYHLSEGTAENIIESFYHLVKCRDIRMIVKMLEEEVRYEKYRFIEEGFAVPLLEILKLVKTLGISGDMMIYVYCMEGKAFSMLEKMG